ncbi:hypothetical protein ACHMW5_13640 [Azospirillum melinis]|uniref:hypothetical protein n=1 Tax=Azospirillum melinis TaxID=328839 RepID=UPI003756F318
MVDHTPTDETVIRQPAEVQDQDQIDAVLGFSVSDKPVTQQPVTLADLTRFGWAPGGYQCFSCNDCGRAFEGAKRCIRCRSCAEKLAAGPYPSDAQSSEDYQRVDGGRSLEGNQPVAPLSPQDIAEMREALRQRAATKSVFEFQQIGGQIAHKAPRLLDAIEALTAENARLTRECERHAADNPRLVLEWREEPAQARVREDALKAELAELRGQYLADFGQRYQPEMYATTDHGWYATHRAKVEAAAVAAKIAKRQAECRNCRDGFPAYVTPADWDTCPDCGKRFGAAKEVAQ